MEGNLAHIGVGILREQHLIIGRKGDEQNNHEAENHIDFDADGKEQLLQQFPYSFFHHLAPSGETSRSSSGGRTPSSQEIFFFPRTDANHEACSASISSFW